MGVKEPSCTPAAYRKKEYAYADISGAGSGRNQAADWRGYTFLPFLEKFCPACNFWQGCGVYFIAKAAWCAAAFASITNCKEKQT